MSLLGGPRLVALGLSADESKSFGRTPVGSFRIATGDVVAEPRRAQGHVQGVSSSGVTDTDAPRANRDLLIWSWIFAVPAIGGFLLALGLMLFPSSFDNDGAFQKPMSCGVPALFDRQAFTKQHYGPDGELGELGTSGCDATVAAREHQAVGALAVATPLGLLALTLHLHRRTATGQRAGNQDQTATAASSHST
ncbi:hypothetical protein [Streptomyces yokosukanensis]|nr:hypothetical protein [Streptomyces yokosukanensis]